MSGPYETEHDAAIEPMPRAVSALHRAGRVRTGDPDRIVHGTMLAELLGACADAGIEVGAYDRRILSWAASWETTTAQVFADLIRRAHAAGAATRGAIVVDADLLDRLPDEAPRLAALAADQPRHFQREGADQ